MKDEFTAASVKAAPPTAVTVYSYLLGMPIEKWVSIATLIYVLLQGYFLLIDRIEKRRERKGDDE